MTVVVAVVAPVTAADVAAQCTTERLSLRCSTSELACRSSANGAGGDQVVLLLCLLMVCDACVGLCQLLDAQGLLILYK